MGGEEGGRKGGWEGRRVGGEEGGREGGRGGRWGGGGGRTHCYLDAKMVIWERRMRVGSDVASKVSPFISKACTPGKCGHFSLESNISRQSNVSLRERSRRSNT